MAREQKPTPAADHASERVGAVLAAAESAAAEIVEEAEAEADRIIAAARAEADRIRAAARSESEETVGAANREASGRVEQARGAVEGLIAQADKLRAQVGALGRDLASNMPGAGSSAAEEPVAADSPPDPPSVKPAAKPVATEPVATEPVATETVDAAPSDDELIAALRGGDEQAAADRPVAPAKAGTEPAAARLVAMNMALDGASRERIAERIESEFGTVDGVDELLDDVLRRAGR